MKRKYIGIICALIAVSVVVLALAKSSVGRSFRGSVEATTAHLSSSVHETFPSVDTSQLSPTRAQMINIARQEYAKKPVSYDQNVMKYSNGVRESWCADFVSWVMRESGSPLANPNSGGWRIPGVLTLKEYYQQSNRYRDARSYTPKPGDVAIYVGTTYYGTDRQHTNIVLSVEDGKFTTIGGNESGRLRITHHKLQYGERGLVGFGLPD